VETGGWTRIEELFHQAADLAPAERAAFLNQVCGNDEELRRELESLLAADTPQVRMLQTEAVRQFQANPDEEGSGLIAARIGRYTITDEIGRGGMGAVYGAVRNDDFHMKVAIKLLKRGTDTEAALRRFRTERQILAGLQHPNIACLLDGGATGSGLPYFVMEYVDGTPLLEYAAPLSVCERLELFRAVCSAVAYAHRNQVVHRDIKPANILVNKEGVPKLLDFGIARLLDPAEQGPGPLTLTGMRLMTPAYASPEQVRGETVNEATDIYSLGAVLYELLTNRRAHPVENSSLAEIEREICTHDPERPSAVNRDLDPDLDNIVLMALRTEPARRYGSVEQLSGDLDRFLHDQPVLAREETVRYRTRKFLKRNRVSVTAATLSAALVLAFTLALAGVGRINRPAAGTESGVRSIAVLPLENLSGDKEQEYFSDGVTDALISDLAGLPSLRVISRTSVMTYKNARPKIPEIGHSLGVGTIAEGSVFRSGNRIRIAMRLIDAAEDRTVWSGTYEGELKDVLTLQSRVAEAIAGEIHVTLTTDHQKRVARQERVNLDAYGAYLKGRYEYFSGFTQGSMESAIGHFQQALALDPGYAPAYAGLADCYYMVSNMYFRPTEVMPKAKAAALKALEIDDTLGEAYATLALVRSVYDFDRGEAEKGFRRAIELKPSDAEAHLWYALHLTGMGRFDEALAEMKRSRALDPVSPAIGVYVVWPLYFARRYDEAIGQLRPIVEMNPDYVHAHALLALCYEQKGQLSDAIAEMEKAWALDKEPESLAQLGHMYAMAGSRKDAMNVIALLKELARKRYVSVYEFAVLYAGLGQRDEAFRWLEKVGEDRSEFFALVNVDPRLDVLHSDPRFGVLKRAVGLEP
jgi:serine/threonine protein kinase/tetratricopeptide (TPR) repeat protein